MPDYAEWTPPPVLQELDLRIENAFRRASGSAGYDISYDTGRSKAMKDTVSDMLQAGAETPGPMFLRVGSGMLQGRGLNLGVGVSPKSVAGDILYEFYNEGNTAFQAAKAALRADAFKHMSNSGITEAQAQGILQAAEAVFVMPAKDEFSQAAKPLCEQKLSPATLAFMGMIAGFAFCLALLRVPHIAFAGAVLGGGLGYYFGRNRQRSMARKVITHLPRILYDLLRTSLQGSAHRYADVVNSALRKM